MIKNMNNPYDLLKGILALIEKKLKDNINIDNLAEEYSISSRHLERLFKFGFNQTLGSYIRSRKLSESINDLLNYDLKILSIALDYSFEYEQSYIRSFRREFGLTPGEFRKKGKILKITPPIHLFDYQKFPEGVMFGPDIVIVPRINLIGKRHKIPLNNVEPNVGNAVSKFLNNERKCIKNIINPNILYNISTSAGEETGYCFFMPAAQVNSFDYIPKGMEHYTFETSICARFRFISPFNEQLNMHIADKMFKAIDNFMNDENQKYFLERDRVNMDKFDIITKNSVYKQWEWFSPVKIKS